MKKLLIALGCLIVLFVAAALIVPSFIDWNDYRAEIAAEAERVTGRPVTLDGDISLGLFPSPAFSAKGVRLGNIDGGSAPAMLSLDEVSVEVAFWPLLTGAVKVQSIVLRRPVVLLERLADGRANWDFGRTAEGQAGSSGTAAGSAPPAVSLDSLEVEDGTVIYRDAATGREEKLEAIDATISATSLQGPFTVKGTARARGLDGALTLDVGSLKPGAQTPIKLGLTLPAGATQVGVTGYLTPEGPAFQGSVTVKGADLAALLAQATGAAAPAPLAQAFEIVGKVTADPTAVRAEELQMTLGPSRGSGSLAYLLTPQPRLEADLAIPQLDLDSLLAAGDATATPAQDTSGAAPGGTATLLPPGLTGSVTLAIEALTYRGQAIRQVDLAATIEDDVVTLERTRMALPGPSDLALSGQVTLTPGAPGFTGTLSLTSDNLRNLLGWLGAEPAGVAPERLRRLVFGSEVALRDRQLSLTNLSAQLDSSTLRGAVVIALGDRLGIGAGLTLDRLNLDAYLPASDGGDGGGTPGAASSPLALLDRYDANLDLKIGSLTWRETPLADIALQGTLQGGLLTVKQARIGEVAGGTLSYSGTVAAQGPALDGTLELSARDSAKLARLAGLDPATLAPLGPFGLTANLKGGAEALAFNARLKAQGGDFTGAGTLTAGQPLTLAVTARHPDLPALTAALGREGALPAGFGGLDAAAEVTLAPDSIALAKLSGQVGPLAIQSGAAAVDLAGERPVVTLDLAAGPLDLAGLPAGPGAGGGKPAGGERWSTAPLGLAGLRALDGTARLAVAAVTDGDLVLRDAKLELTLAQGLLEVKSLTGVLNGGALQATGRIDAAADTPALGLGFSLAGMTLDPLLAGALPLGELAGRLDAKGQLAASGNSLADLLGTLDGTLDSGGSVTLRTGGLGAAGAGIGGTLLEQLLGPEAKGLAQIKNVSDGAALLLQALADHDTPFVARLAFAQGQATLTEVRADGRGLYATATGTAQLRPFTGDITLATFLNDRPDEAYYREHRVGPLDDPAEIERGGLLLSGGAPAALPTAEPPDPIGNLIEEMEKQAPASP